MIELLLDGADDLRVTVPRINHGNTSGEIDIAIALHIPHLRVQSALRINRKYVAHPTREYGFFSFLPA